MKKLLIIIVGFLILSSCTEEKTRQIVSDGNGGIYYFRPDPNHKPAPPNLIYCKNGICKFAEGE